MPQEPEPTRYRVPPERLSKIQETAHHAMLLDFFPADLHWAQVNWVEKQAVISRIFGQIFRERYRYLNLTSNRTTLEQERLAELLQYQRQVKLYTFPSVADLMIHAQIDADVSFRSRIGPPLAPNIIEFLRALFHHVHPATMVTTEKNFPRQLSEELRQYADFLIFEHLSQIETQHFANPMTHQPLSFQESEALDWLDNDAVNAWQRLIHIVNQHVQMNQPFRSSKKKDFPKVSNEQLNNLLTAMCESEIPVALATFARYHPYLAVTQQRFREIAQT